MESSATDCNEMSRGEHANRHDVRFVANLARNLGGCDQDIFGKISRSRTSLKGSSVIVTVTRTIRFVTGERRLHCQMPYLRLPMIFWLVRIPHVAPWSWACDLCYDMNESGYVEVHSMIINMNYEVNDMIGNYVSSWLQTTCCCIQPWVPTVIWSPER